DKHKTGNLLYGNPPEIIDLERNSNEFYLVQRIQEEVHRFAISFHRQLRSKGLIQSELDKISGVGEKRRQLLLTHLQSVERIKKEEKKDITNLGIPINIAENILNTLQNTD